MLTLNRTHDFQLFTSPANNKPHATNPPSFNWPQPSMSQTYLLEIEQTDGANKWQFEAVASPFQPNFKLEKGQYQWRLTDQTGKTSQWMLFSIDETSQDYLPPSAQELFAQAAKQDQFLMYFDQDIAQIQTASQEHYDRFKKTAALVDIDKITYPSHYRRGEEEGKRTAITNVREWIDRDLMALCLLYKIWQEEDAGEKACELLLRLATWSPEGPASLLRPCTWGDEVGLSLSRNLFLAYHWLSPLLRDSEKDFIRPMLIRIGYQLEERLQQDEFHQYPGHSHTSRLPGYLGVAALCLHKEFDQSVCARWLDYALMIYRGVLPFYGGEDGSWAEGPFYSSSYSKWFHPFFLSVERLSGFSFYNHPFYQNYAKFAMDFVATDHQIHPFGDGFWCRRDGNEWPGFFAQNPLRIYAERFGDEKANATSQLLESKIDTYALHLLDVIPTKAQLGFKHQVPDNTQNSAAKADLSHVMYEFAGFGKAQAAAQSLYFRASPFGNSSHRHGDQGNIALFDKDAMLLIPTGSYGYRFGSGHHSQWTRTTLAHNLPLVNHQGQILDSEQTSAKIIKQVEAQGCFITSIDLSLCYADCEQYVRTLVFIPEHGLVMFDQMRLTSALPVNWRLHTGVNPSLSGQKVLLAADKSEYQVELVSQSVLPNIEFGYEQEVMSQENVAQIISDATPDIWHLDWALPAKQSHQVVALCGQGIQAKLEANQVLIETKSQSLALDLSSLALKEVALAE